MLLQKDEKTEQFSVNLLGLIKFNVTNPGKRTSILIVVILIFTIILILVLKN